MITRNHTLTGRFFLAMLAALFSAASCWAQQLSIESPTPGAVFSPGQTISVTVSVTNGSVLAVQVSGQGMGTTAVQSAAPFTFTLTAPTNVIGPQNVFAIGELGQQDAVFSPTVAVDIEPASAPASIVFNQTLATFGYVGDQRRVGITATFADGSTQDVSSSTNLIYSSSAAKVTSIDSTGLMTCQGIGSATITATYGTLTATLQTQGPSGVTGDLNGDGVINSDDLALLELSLGDTPALPGDGRNLDGDTTIDAGDVTALLALCGSACPSLSTTTTVLGGIPAQIAYAQSLQLTAMVTGSGTTPPTGGVAFLVDGHVQDVGALISPNEAYVTLTSLAAGSHTIEALYEGDTSNAPSTSASASTQVLAPVLASIDVLPASPTVAAGATQQFTAIGSYTDASTQNETTNVTWTSQTPSVATIGASTGLATAVGPGTTLITATLNGVTSPAATLAVGAPAPTLATLSPTSATAGGSGFTLTVTGTNFISGSVINFNGVAEATTYVSATQLTAAIPASAIASSGTVPVKVTTPAPGGGTSSAVNFTINAAVTNNPAPTLATISPTSATAGASGFTLTVTGTNFISVSVVNFNGMAETTTYVSATQLTAAIPASAITKAGTAPMTVTNPAPGGGTSSAVNFTINAVVANNPVPTLATISPTSATAGTSGFTLTMTGTNFISSSVVNFNGVAETTTYVSATELTAAIPAGAITAAGGVPVTVTTPAPGGGTTSAVTFTVNAAPVPTFTLSSSTSPQTVQPGGSAQYSISIAAQNGTFAGSVALTASGLPSGATATFSPASASPGNSSVTSQLTIQTSSASAALIRKGAHWPLTATILPFLGLCFIGASRCRWIALCLVLISSLGAATLTGCGGNSGSKNTSPSPQAYTITVTGTSGSETQTATVQLTVQ